MESLNHGVSRCDVLSLLLDRGLLTLDERLQLRDAFLERAVLLRGLRGLRGVRGQRG